MPYHIERAGSQYSVVDDKGKTVGTHPSKKKAAAQVRALYANVPDATKEDVIRMGVRRSGVGDSHSGISSSGAIASTGGAGMGISAADQINELTAVVKQLINEVPSGTPGGTEEPSTSEYKDCGCATCSAMGVDCPKCPACTPAIVGDGKDAEFAAAKEETAAPVVKRDYSASTRERMAENNVAMPDGSFPIANATDLHNAVQSVGRAKDYEAAKKHIISRARALGMISALPESWRATAKMTEWGGSIFDLNPFVK